MGENLNKNEIIGSLETEAFTLHIKDPYNLASKGQKIYDVDLRVRNNMRDNYTECVFHMEELIKLLENNKSDISLKLLECLKPFLLELNNDSADHKTINIIEPKGSYLMRLYYILRNKDHIFEISLDELYSLISNKYERYTDFKKCVLEKSKKELKKNSDITFTYKEIKTGRKVTSLKFYIKPNMKFNDEVAATKEEQIERKVKQKFESKVFDFESLKNKLRGQYRE